MKPQPATLVKCPWCGRERVSLTAKQLLAPHVGPGGQRCVGGGLSLPGSRVGR